VLHRGRLLLAPLATLGLALGFAAILFPSCNEHGLVPFDTYVKKGVFQSGSVQKKTQFDILWLVDNSNSMCQEQENLTRNFTQFIDQLAGLEADFKMGVITTDVEDSNHSGKLQSKPAQNLLACIRANYHVDDNYCVTDGDCGIGGCLCGVPFIQHCAQDADCPADRPACVASSGQSSLRFCSRSCVAGDESCLDPTAPNGVFVCGQAPGRDGNHCLLRTCTADQDCPADVLQGNGSVKYEYVCAPPAGEPGVSYCRRQENFNFKCSQGRCPAGGACDPITDTCPTYSICPAPTCDCPAQLPPALVMNSAGGAVDPAVARNFRCMATVGTEGSGTERGLQAIQMFLDRDAKLPEAERFLRPKAHLVIVIVADEDDCSGFDNGRLPSDLGLRACVWYKDQLDSVADFVARVKEAKKAPAEVVVASIVGIQDLKCVQGCPTPAGESCVEASGCAGECPVPTFCAERVFRYDEVAGRGEDPAQSCSSPNGLAYSGDRYIEFSRAFDNYGMDMSICQASFAEALGNLADLIKSVDSSYCLTDGLRSCDADEDCPTSEVHGQATCRSYWRSDWELGRGQCLGPEGQLLATVNGCTSNAECGEGGTCDTRSICRWDAAHGGSPADLRVFIRRSGATEGAFLDPATDWSFLPDKEEGCLGFTAGKGPGPADFIEIQYVAGVKL